MLSKDHDLVLANLAKIEVGLSKIYQCLSECDNFTEPVKKFWEEIAKEELTHAKVFNDIRSKASIDSSFQVDILIDNKQLKHFVKKVNSLVKEINKKDSNELEIYKKESEAYKFGASLEGDLDESNFLRRIEVNDTEFAKKLQQIEHATKKHSIIMINYSRGIK
jgi:translation elongation factor EF-Ts